MDRILHTRPRPTGSGNGRITNSSRNGNGRIASLVLMGMLLLVACSAHDATASSTARVTGTGTTQGKNNERQRQLRYSNDSSDGPQHVSIDEFAVRYGPTLQVQPGSNVIQIIIEKAVEAYVTTQTVGLEYLLLTNVQDVVWSGNSSETDTNSDANNSLDGDGGAGSRRARRQAQRGLQSDATTLVDFKGGVVSFESTSPEYTKEEVSQWVQDAVHSSLFLDALNEADEYGQVNSAVFIPVPDPTLSPTITPPFTDSPTIAPATTNSPTSALATDTLSPTDAPVTFTGASRGDNVADDDGNDLTWVAIVGGLAAVAFVIVGSVIFVKLRSNRRAPLEKVDEPVEIDDAATDVDVMTDDGVDRNADHQRTNSNGSEPTAEVASEVAQYQAREESIESASIASSWTMDDSMATSITGNRVKNDLWMASEAFNQDRHVMLQKDMLHTPWSSAQNHMTSPRNDHMLPHSPTAATPQQSGRRRRRDFRSWRTNSNSPRPFVFEQANSGGNGNSNATSGGGEGEEIYLMPTTKQTR